MNPKVMVVACFNKIRWLCQGFLLIVLSGCTQHVVTTASLLGEMADRQQLTYFPDTEFMLKQASSYNRLSVSEGNDAWFANNDMSHFIRSETHDGRREFVMLDTDGPGAIVRWWMTFYKAQYGYIRVYIDHDTVPVIEGMPRDVLSGEVLAGYPFSASLQKGAPLGEEGRDYDHNFYFPIPFSKHCKITYECDSLVMLYEYEGTPVPQGYYWPDVFYNICYREYSADTKVESFSHGDIEVTKALSETTGDYLLQPPANSGKPESIKAAIASGDSFSLQITRANHAIKSLIIAIDAADMSQALRSTVICLEFDEKRTVWVPAGEFFGAGYSLQQHATRMNRTDGNGNMESYWIMPFQKNCTLTVLNYGHDQISLSGEITIEPYDWKSNSMYFGAAWHEYRNINTRNEKGSFFDLNFVDIRGRGVYAGDQITLFNPTYQWWGEGDEKFFVDGEVFPSIFGTGTEDYYGYSFGRPEPFSHPFLSQPVGTGNMQSGMTVNMRHRSLDAIPFNSSLKANMELWHWAEVKMDYALTTYFYIMPPYSAGMANDPASVQFPVRSSANKIETGGIGPTTK